MGRVTSQFTPSFYLTIKLKRLIVFFIKTLILHHQWEYSPSIIIFVVWATFPTDGPRLSHHFEFWRYLQRNGNACLSMKHYGHLYVPINMFALLDQLWLIVMNPLSIIFFFFLILWIIAHKVTNLQLVNYLNLLSPFLDWAGYLNANHPLPNLH